MTTEEKAKAYDEAIEVAQRFYNNSVAITKKGLEDIFPELKESEDERIRKELIEFVKNRGGFKQEYIAWLEKQGEGTDYANKEYWCEYNEGKQEILDKYAELKKQGEQKPNPCENCSIATNNCQKFPCAIRDGEQKPADKVEPKFKVGDWVVRNGETLQISGIDFVLDGTFYYRFTKGTWLSSKKMENAMLWTIQDAKDGDVLSYRDGQWIFIYKGIVTEDTFKYYALFSEKGITVNDAAFSLLASCIIPATKEQRDLLFQKMKEAGYEWDAELKQLRKIEQNTAWSEEDDRMLDKCIKAACSNYYPGISSVRDWLNSLKNRYTWKPSEEQIVAIDTAINVLGKGTLNGKQLIELQEQLKKL